MATATLIVVLAAAVATLAAFRPSLSSPHLTPRFASTGVATAQVLVDRPVSVLSSMDSDAEATSLLALTYVQYLRTDYARLAIAAAAHVDADALQVSGPYTILLSRTSLARTQPVTPPRGDVRYRLLLDATPRRPIITIAASAPTAREAVALVTGTRVFLRHQLAKALRADPAPPGDNATLRPLGPTVGHVILGPAPGAIFGIVFALGLAIAGLVAGRRRTARPPPGPPVTQADDWPHTRRPLPWALAGFLAMIWLVPFAAIAFPGKLDRVVLAVVLLIWLGTLTGRARHARAPLRLTAVHAAALAFLAVAAVSVIANAATLANLAELGPSIKKVALLASMLAFLTIAGSTLRPAEVPRMISFMLGLAAFAAVGAIVEYRLGTNIFYGFFLLLPGGRVSSPPDLADTIGRISVFGPTAHPLEIATMLGVALMFAIVRVLAAEDRRDRVLYAGLSTVLLAGLLSTQRKTAVIAPAAGILLIAAYRPRDITRKLLPLCLVIGVVVHALAPGALGGVIEQLHPTNATSSLSTQDRASDYAGIAPDLRQHPFTGRGYGSYDPLKYRILDNQYLGLVVEGGFLGLLAYLTLFGVALAAAHRVTRSRDRLRAPPALGASAALMVLAVANALFDVLSFPHVVYLMFFVCGLLISLEAPETQRAPETPLPEWDDVGAEAPALSPAS